MRTKKIVVRRKYRKKISEWLVISSNIRAQNYPKLRNKTIIKPPRKLRKIFPFR
jgi:t-SNARE complex subunit (syntaxin)